jgi:hypothetical protein
VAPSEGRPVAPDPRAVPGDPEVVVKTAEKAPLHKVLIDSDPAGAQISVSGQVVGDTPIFVEWSGEHVDVVVTKVGYRPVHQQLGPSTGRAIRVALQPVD